MKTNSKHIVFFLLIFNCIAPALTAQNILYAKKKHTAKTHKIETYDFVTVKVKNKEPIKGQLTGIDDVGFLVSGTDVLLKDVEWIRTHHQFWKGLGRSLEIGGLVFLGVFSANSLITGNQPFLTDGNLIFIGSLLVAGVTLELISRKTYRAKKGWVFEPILFDSLPQVQNQIDTSN